MLEHQQRQPCPQTAQRASETRRRKDAKKKEDRINWMNLIIRSALILVILFILSMSFSGLFVVRAADCSSETQAATRFRYMQIKCGSMLLKGVPHAFLRASAPPR